MTPSPGHETPADGARPSAEAWRGPVLVVEDLSQQRLPARRMVALLRDAGLPAVLVDLGLADAAVNDCGKGTQALLELAHHARPRLIVFSILFADRLAETLGIVAALRRAGIGSQLALAGLLPGFAAAALLAVCPELDSVVGGEVEEAIVKLAPSGSGARSESAKPPGGTGPNELKLGTRPRSLDEQPPPVQDGPLPAFRNIGFVTVEASRGCYHRCSFCLPAAHYRAAGTPYRLRSIENLVDEMEALYRRGARLFLFDDEQFLPPVRLREARVAALGEALRRRAMTIAFTLKCRAGDVETGLFQTLKDMGLVRAYVGIESGCQATLDLFAKDVSVDRNLAALATLDRLGIVADMRCLVFHPWSTLKTIEEDLAFWQRALPLIPSLLCFREIAIYPGTSLAERCQAEGKTHGPPWALAYTLADPCAELLRRLSHLVFSSSAMVQAAERQVAEAWYAVLLAQRFPEAGQNTREADDVRAAAARWNANALAIWSEMVRFVTQEDILDAGLVNERAGRWAEVMGHACHRLAPR